MRQTHRSEKSFVITAAAPCRCNAAHGKVRQAQVFVGVLGAYAEASWGQTLQ